MSVTELRGRRDAAHPHQGQPVLAAGAPLDQAKGAVILVHGRGANAQSMLALAQEFPLLEIAYLAPQAAGYTWYPQSFLAPQSLNEPGLTSGLRRLGELVEEIAGAGIPAERIVLLGFSQGACLTLEYAARNPRRYGGVVGLSGGLIGPDETPRDYPGSLAGTPIFIGCSDVDPHIPLARVELSAAAFERLGGAVTKRVYPGMGHTVNADEVEFIGELLTRLAG